MAGGPATARLSDAERRALQHELDDLQRRYPPGQAQPSAAALAPPAVPPTMSFSAGGVTMSKAERMLALLEEGKVAGVQTEGQQSRKRDFEDILLRKDGLDLSLQHLRSNACRMREHLTEVGLALGRPGREAAAKRLERQSIPVEVREQFEDQQRILVEQKRVLEQLRCEKIELQEAQFREVRSCRKEYVEEISKFDNGGDKEPRIRQAMPDPSTLDEARRLLRQEVVASKAGGAIDAAGQPIQAAGDSQAPAQDGYLLVEVYGMEGLGSSRLATLRDLTVEVLIGTSTVITQAAVAAPLELSPARPKRIQLTIEPDRVASQFSVRIWLHGSGRRPGAASATVPFGALGEDRLDPRPLRLVAEGAWEDNDATPIMLSVAMSGVAPIDARGAAVANQRVVANPTNASRTAWASALPPSQAHTREHALAWMRDGAPEPRNERELLESADARDSHARGSFLGLGQEDSPEPDQERVGFFGFAGMAETPRADDAESEGPAGISFIQNLFKSSPALDDAPADNARSEFDGRSATLTRGATAYREEPELSASLEPEPSPFQSEVSLPPLRHTAKRGSNRASMDFSGSASAGRAAVEPILAVRSAPMPWLASSFGERAATPRESTQNVAPAPPLMAFAGEVSLEGSSQRRSRVEPAVKVSLHGKNIGLKLRPPSSIEPVKVLFDKLRKAMQRSGLTAAHAQMALELAARVAQPGALAVEEAGAIDDRLAEYAGVMLDSLQSYTESVTMCLWCLDALIGILGAASSGYHAQLAVVVYDAYENVAFRFSRNRDVEVHERLLAGLVAVIGPESNVNEESVVDYVVDQLSSHRGSLPPRTIEHALGILCAVAAAHRLDDQLEHVVCALRDFKSDAHLATRALVAIAELGAISTAAAPRVGAARDDGDVRLVLNAMDLYASHRKMAGAGAKALATLARLDDRRLAAIVSTGQRVMLQAQRTHVDSRSVNLHVAEVLREAARAQPELLTDASVTLLAQSLRAHWRDAEVAAASLDALAYVASAASSQHLEKVLKVFPASQVLTLGDAHTATNATTTAALLRLVATLAEASPSHGRHFVANGVAEVCLRAIEVQTDDGAVAAVACQALKRLAIASREAQQSVAKLDAIRPLYGALVQHREDPQVARHSLAAIAVVAQKREARLQLADPGDPSARLRLQAIMDAAAFLAPRDPDVLAWACCAVGALTFAEEEDGKGWQTDARRVVSEKVLQSVCRNIGRERPAFRTDALYFLQLLNRAPVYDLAVRRLLGRDGSEVGRLQPRGRAKTQSLGPAAEAGEKQARLRESERRRGQGRGAGAAARYDPFEVMRTSVGLGGQVLDTDSEGNSSESEVLEEEVDREPDTVFGALASLFPGLS